MRIITEEFHPSNIAVFRADTARDAILSASDILLSDRRMRGALWINPACEGLVPVFNRLAIDNPSAFTVYPDQRKNFPFKFFPRAKTLPEDVRLHDTLSPELREIFGEVTVELRKSYFESGEAHHDGNPGRPVKDPSALFGGRSVRALLTVNHIGTEIFDDQDFSEEDYAKDYKSHGNRLPVEAPVWSAPPGSVLFPCHLQWGPARSLLHKQPSVNIPITGAPRMLMLWTCHYSR